MATVTSKKRSTKSKTSSTKTTKTGKTKTGSTKSSKNKANTTYKRGTLGQVVYNYLYTCEKKKVDPSYDECLALAQKAMPETKFDKSHYSWYKTQYKNMELAEKKKKAGVE